MLQVKAQQVSNFNKVEAAYLVVFSWGQISHYYYFLILLLFLFLFYLLFSQTSLPQPLFTSLLPVPSLSSFTGPLSVLFTLEKAMSPLISSKQIWQYVIKLHIKSHIKTGKGNPSKRKRILRADKRIRNTPFSLFGVPQNPRAKQS